MCIHFFIVGTYVSMMQKSQTHPDIPKKLIFVCLATLGFFALILISQANIGYKSSLLQLTMPANIDKV